MNNTSINSLKLLLHGIEHNVAAHIDKINSKEKDVIGNPMFSVLAKNMELDLSRDYKFVKFPLFLTKEPDDEINVCSVCFGALSLMKKDENKLDKVMVDYLNATINSLILLHLSSKDKELHQEFIFWPRNYYLGATQSEAGTLNQTSLSLSALAVLGFLDEKSPITGKYISDEALKHRLLFVVKAIKWILSSQRIDALSAAWSYATKSTTIDNKPINSAVLPTFYCIKTIDKYLNIFKRDRKIMDILEKIYPNLLTEMEVAIKLSIKYLAISQNQNGGIGRNNIENTSSYFHSILALQILVIYGTNEFEAINKYLNYIIKISPNNFLKYIGKDIFEKYRYQVFRLIPNRINDEETQKWIDVYDTESFEIFPEAMIIIAGLHILDYLRANSLKSKRYINYFRKLIYVMYRKLLKRIYVNGNNVYIRGRRGEKELEYPIYCLYYGRKCIKRLLEYDEFSLKKLINKRITFDRWLIFICLVAIVVIVISMLLDCKNTILAGLTTLITSLITFIVKKIRGEQSIWKD